MLAGASTSTPIRWWHLCSGFSEKLTKFAGVYPLISPWSWGCEDDGAASVGGGSDGTESLPAAHKNLGREQNCKMGSRLWPGPADVTTFLPKLGLDESAGIL